MSQNENAFLYNENENHRITSSTHTILAALEFHTYVLLVK